MGVREKTIAIVVSALLCAGAAFLGLTRYFYARGIDTLGQQEAVAAFERIRALAQDDLDQLALLATDWGVWDDTYEYVIDRNPGYEESNLYEQALRSIQLSYFGIYDNVDELVVFREIPAAGAAQDLHTAPRARHLGPGSLLYLKAKAEGLATAIVVTGEGLELACIRKIFRSDGTGASVGFLIMIRSLDAARVARWARLTGTIATVAVERGLGEYSEDGSPAVRHNASGLIEARGALPGSEGGGSVALATVSPLRLYDGFDDQVRLGFLLSLAFVAVTIGVAILFIVEHFILHRLDALGGDLELIAAAGTPTLCVKVSGHDELSRFGEILNRTLDALERSFLDNERDRRLLTASLQEREVMFREIRHRVKNNLQIVASLLNLQADGSSKATAKALYESRRRVLAMAFVHEELYSSESLDRVGLAEYLSRLSVSVRDGADQERRITLSSEFDQITLEIERAVPFGLIANEVLTNAYMHAFPPESYDGGTICMRLKYGPEGRATFSVDDDGIGLPADIDRSLKLGLSLIDTLASQISATTEYGRPEGGGTRFSMNFPARMVKTKASDDLIDTSVVLSMNTDSTIL